MQTNQSNSHHRPTSPLVTGVFVLLFTLFAAAADVQAQSGTWTNLLSGIASGSWATAANWNNSVIADGADNTADFSTLDITTTNSVVTLDGARTIGNLIFGDTTPDTNWVLNTGSAGPLTLAVSSGMSTVTVNNQRATINAVLSGTNGLAKAGPGTLRLGGANTTLTNNPSLPTTINVNAGILQVDNNNALGPTGTLTSSNRVAIANGATLEVISQRQPNFQRVTLSGAGVGGTQGAIFADLTGVAGGNANTRLSIGLTTVANPALTMSGDTTIRVDGADGFNPATMLIGHITGNFTLTKTGTGQMRIDPAGGYSGGDIHIASGSIALGNNNDLVGTQTVTIDPGAGLYCRNITSLNSINSSLVVNGLLDLNARGPADTTIALQTIGTLSGSGVITNDNNNTETLIIAGTNGTSTTFSGKIVKTTTGTINLRVQQANGTLRLTGANTYEGTTTVNAGTLLVNGTHTGGAPYTVIPGATLGGSGSISAPIILDGMLVAGDGGGTLTVSNVTGAGDVVVSNANLTVTGQLNNSGSGNLNSLYLNNSVTTINLQGGNEASIYATAVNVDGTANTLNVQIAVPNTGQFPLIGGISSIGGLNGFSGLNLQVPAGVGAYLSNNITSIDLVVTSTPSLTWIGTPTGDWTIGGPTNWLNGSTPSAYTESAGVGPFVIFDDTAAGSTTVNLITDVRPRGLTVNANSKTYVLSGTGSVAGTNNWLKEGSSTFAVANSGANNFAGSVTVNGGTLQIGNGGASGNLGAASIINSASGSLAFNRSDDVRFANAISGNGSLIQQGSDKVDLTSVGNVGGSVTVNAGTLTLSPPGSITVAGDVAGNGAFGTAGGTVVLTGANITYAGGTVITNGTLQFNTTFPPAGNITNNGTLALAVSGTLANNVSGSGGVSVINAAAVALAGANSYSGPTIVVSNSSIDATAASYPSGSVLRLGGQIGGSATGGAATFSAGNPVIGGLVAGYSLVTLSAGGQTLSINGNMSVGNTGPSAVSALFQLVGTGSSLVVNTNGGTIQVGLYTNAASGNPDNVLVDLSGIDNFVANLGTGGSVNLGTLDQNSGPPAGATVVNQFRLAAVSNSITAGTVTIGAGGRQLTPELRLGAGTNVINTDTLRLGAGGRDGGALLFDGATGGLRVRAVDGVSRANMNVGVAVTTTGAAITNTVDLTTHSADLLLNALVMGSLNNAGAYQCTFSFDQGVLDALSTSMAVLRNNNGNPGICTMNIGGGTASLGPVSLTASAGQGTLNITGGSVAVQGITDTGSGTGTLNVAGASLSSVGRIGTAANRIDVIDLNNTSLGIGRSAGFGNPTTALVNATTLNISGTCPITLTGTNYVVGQFPLISYVGSIGGGGYPSIGTFTPPPGVIATLVDNSANQSIDVNITVAPPLSEKASITATAGSGTVNLSWNDLGMILQTNAVSLASPESWFTYPGSTAVTNLTITIDPGTPNVFFRLLYP